MKSCSDNNTTACRHAHALISLVDVSMGWDMRQVLTDVTLDVNNGDFMAITGPNGGGKTTLLRIMLKLLKPTAGRVIYHDCESQGCDSPLIGYLPQKNMIDSHFPVSVSEVISSGLLATKGLTKSRRDALVDDTIRLIGLEEHINQPIGALSGGQLQRTLLGRAIISRPRILVLDEPLSYVDKRFESQFYDIIAQLAQTSTIVLVSHEMTMIAEMANRHIIVDHSIHECAASHHYARRSECE